MRPPWRSRPSPRLPARKPVCGARDSSYDAHVIQRGQQCRSASQQPHRPRNGAPAASVGRDDGADLVDLAGDQTKVILDFVFDDGDPFLQHGRTRLNRSEESLYFWIIHSCCPCSYQAILNILAKSILAKFPTVVF